MASQEPILNLTYSELLMTTEVILRQSLRLRQGEIPDTHDRGLCRGVILHWYHLSLQSGTSEAQCQADMAQLCQLAGIPGDSEEQAADGR
ncbi:hypothetical protein AAY84_23790 [Serratia marcescens]|uniref:hypothetical protein n=1 Tax=Enterobacterales TaxID=91347 RepID=UPI00062C83C7|nr:hypothetical protein [Serratia marcescens]KKZ15812.1 hypothetical protein AAY84_23790 [Serratia marcescens]